MARKDVDGRVPALVRQGKYEEAVELLDQWLIKSPDDDLLYRERAHLHLYFGDYQKARSDLDTVANLGAAAFHERPGRLHSDSEFNGVGVTYWAEGHKELATAFWRYTTDLLYNGRVSYSHQGGGIEAALLLWFGAVHQRNEEDVALVRKFYEKRLASKYFDVNSWPFPLARFFLKNIAETDLLNDAKRPQSACEAHFALAIRAREDRRHAAYRKHLQLAAPGKSPSEIYEYYNVWCYFVAKHENGGS